MTPLQRQDMKKMLELEERWHPLNIRLPGEPLFHWIVAGAAIVCMTIELVYQVALHVH